MRNVFKDDKYQGLQKKNYFEGWYFKSVTSNQNISIAVIPGVSLAIDDRHAFIQVFVYTNNTLEKSVHNYYFRFDINDFKADKHKFEVSIKDNKFSLEGITLNLEDEDTVIRGNYQISNPVKLPQSLLQPTIMGPFSYLPLMECYHGILSMNHTISGTIYYNDIAIDFNEGRGYIEKDYGKSFPKGYVWVQTNHFEKADTSLFLSVAAIPYLGITFNGFIVNFYHNLKHYRFATYNGSKIKVEDIGQKEVRYSFRKRKYTLEVEAKIDDFVTLASPKFGKMDHTIKEGLSGFVKLKLMKKGIVIFEGTSGSAGIEIMKRPNIKDR
ncbi:tocopherol cyclase family protein [Acholeplasma laidlawii]|jgi:hypothetical protein|uniref:Tocopherol cyclase n=2 Tax=Acholeplasma laidlawii TaxID=2148 RepID=A9NE29_ACHLI|nr:tocopherol cyclase family protein [Acholeplasma laidlawii]ABX81989.1 conserved hypothetical protein [Acholeplasma laidlawii PG-8A]NWH10970.1 hypothetical protein [Acholeplasma laidlawii]NWH12356.1 hypothetical protein [Acholeplasma laidlawii]NWH13742.1 hypothetical protein [Acholeplasma laidlawii]NWH14936.1 hypothetical protein [Acholeplasma laidlawii]